MSDRIPVTILSGGLGAGKTTLLNHLLRTADDREIAVLVNDMGAVNVDAELIADGSELDPDGGVTELSNGCICCELQDDLETAVVRLARERSFDVLVVESSGISEPAPVARLFTTESRVAARYRVDALVTVLDTRQFLDAFAGSGGPERRGTEGDRPLSDLLVEQVEVSNVVLLNKADRCTSDELDDAEELVGTLQPDAETIRTEFSVVDPDRLLEVELFDASAIDGLAGWKRALEDEHHDHRHPDEVYGVSSFTFRRRRPFHPDRIATTLRDLPDGVVRSKGTLWIAGNEFRQSVSQAGPSVRVTAQGPWIASLPDVEREMYRSNRPDLEWHDDYGDRRTAFVVIGTDVDETAIRTALEDALVTDTEWERIGDGRKGESTDPFSTAAGETVVLRSP
ncbi:CobW family GTP-binding protein [Natrialbaceae archaeon AArc-T1-2]|uniref:CobW family GTP-binding protein n=1 Tax=Natrialbaceae archaeon AArc-T1-2 TaxID=3053904 RepID=UPI00255ACB3F|nr:GTP-binding protein [Natrialbaceae archaeon AArc-T1-2]WIV67982.1 GTP-binding protein [Natrialbaceae archaeon AArc-T1-2]